MRIGITTFGGDGGLSGISRYIQGLVAALPALAPEADFEVLLYDEEEKIFLPGGGGGGRVRPLFFDRRLSPPLLNVAWHQLALPFVCGKRGYDVLFLPAGNRRLPVRVPCPSVGTVHDFASLHVAGKYDPARRFYITRVLPFLARRLTRIITVSESSKRDIVEHAGIPPGRVAVTPLAADRDVYHPRDRGLAAERVEKKYGVRPPYVLYISRIEHPGKNHARLIRAFDRMKARSRLPHSLVLAGSDWKNARAVHRLAAGCASKEDILFTGFVPARDLPDLYCGADLFVFPSLYEGFGLPILEAMACGTAAACSNVSSMPEVAGDAARLFDPLDEEAIEGAMTAILSDEALRRSLEERGIAQSSRFTWERTAAATLAVLAEAAREGRRGAAPVAAPAAREEKEKRDREATAVDELQRRLAPGSAAGLAARIRYARKKYAWVAVVGGARLLKRAVDVAGSLYLLAVLSPVFAAVALAIKLTDGGPVFHTQTRVGRWGRPFRFPKFRSMVMDAERLKAKLMEQNLHDDRKTFKMKRDPRVTRVGRIIRRLSIDEIPQLVCVLKGDMSLVGPRPPLPEEVARYSLADRKRLDVLPGLTCIWQVSGRSDIPFDKQLELDVRYIESRSFLTDLKLLAATVPAVLLGKGAY